MEIANELENYEKLGCLHEIITRRANETPEKVAIVTIDGKKTTFEKLNFMADQLANHLRKLGVGRAKIAGILMEKCLEHVVAQIAILKAGGAFFAIDTSFPKNYVQMLLEDARPIVVCTKQPYENLLNSDIASINLDDKWLETLAVRNGYDNVKPTAVQNVSLDDPAFVVFSSGTTGKPKGVVCPHRGSVIAITWRHLLYPYEDDEREACNIFFVWEIIRPLMKGVSAYIVPDTILCEPSKLIEFIRENKITRILFTPSVLENLLNSEHHHELVENLKSLKKVFVSGEMMSMTLRNRTAAALPHVKIINLYAVSETHDISYAEVTDETGLDERTYCPAGKICPLTELKILDENLSEKPMGETGEIYVSGPLLSLGYLNRPDLNAEKFVKIPSISCDNKTNRWFKTGDMGYLLSNGNLEILGRADSTISIRGHKIELKAVEDAILHIPQVNLTCVISVPIGPSDRTLVAYVVMRDGAVKDSRHLRASLRRQFPVYMVPSKFIFLDNVPISEATGKIDKKRLPPIEIPTANETGLDDRFKNEPMKSIAEIWCSILEINVVDPDDNFFDVGGHSLIAAHLISKINDRFGAHLSIADFYLSPTIEALAQRLQGDDCRTDITVDLRAELNKFHFEPISNITLRTFWKSVNFCKEKFYRCNILLTGVTGFLGSFVLQHLLNNTQVTVYCLIKSPSVENARERITNVLNERGLSVENNIDSRVIPVCGNISLKKFGLEDIDYVTLLSSVDAVIHCACVVNLALPYSALYLDNVLGTYNIVSFCMESKLKFLHYISTTDIICTDENESYCENMDTNSQADKLTSGYGQTKWLAEQIVFKASQEGLPTVITRSGNISGPRSVAYWNKKDLILLIIRGIIATGVAPDIPWKIELTPVDFTAEIIVKLTTQMNKTFNKVYHLVDKNSINCDELWSTIRKAGYKLETVSYANWVENVIKCSVTNTQLQPLTYLLTTILKNEKYLVNGPKFDRENLNEFLSSTGRTYPLINRFQLDKYIQNLIRGGYIPPPRQINIVTDKINSRLRGRIALITGASSGIGCELAKAMSRLGVVTIGVARRYDKLAQLQKELMTEGLDNFIPMKMDVTNKDEVFSVISNISTRVGPIDILVNNAGIQEYCTMTNCDLGLWMDMVNVNCIGFLNVTAAVLPHMKETQFGDIVNITSDAGLKTYPGLAVYCGTKFFQEAVSDSMRQEIAELNIKVLCIEPGDVETGLHAKSHDKKALAAYTLPIQYLRTNEIIDTILFVLNQPRNCAINSVLIEPINGPL